jgi:two-component system sensor histidine kinase AtoS
MLIFLLGSLALIIGFLQSRTIRSQMEGRGLSIAQSLAAASITNLLTYNYVALERTANQAARDPDIVWVIFHDKEGRVAGFSGRADLQNTFLDDDMSRKAIAAKQPLIQELSLESGKLSGLDIAVPVFPLGFKAHWGTVRVRLSLVPMYQQIRQIQWIILTIGLIALACGTLMSIWAARRITLPLGNLVHGTQEAARGNLNQDIRIRTGDEVEVLASNFAAMTREILAHREQMKKQLKEIKRLQRYTEKLLTSMNDGLLSVDMAGQISTINPAACKMLGISDDKIDNGTHVSGALQNFSEFNVYIQGAINNPIDRNPQEIFLHKSDDVRIILVSSSILRDRMGRSQEIILNLHDITDLKKLEASIRQAERLAALGTLAAGLAHEIRNPLSSIKTFVQLLPKKIERPGFLEKFQRTVPRELNRINQLVEDLLDLARAPKYQFKKTSIKSLLEQTVNVIGEELQANRIYCQLEISSDMPPVRVDASQLSKAFHNLMRNAVQAMPTGGELSIKAFYKTNDPDDGHITTDRNDKITIVFQDTGPGISAENIKDIFNPFFTTKEKGTGLGLAITHKVITEHGGNVEIKSREGEGSHFIIHLPA